MTSTQISTLTEYSSLRQAHWDGIARARAGATFFSDEYHRRLSEVYRLLVSPGQRVLEIGCGRGDLLAALKPAAGTGVDFSTEMLAEAGRRHPELELVHAGRG